MEEKNNNLPEEGDTITVRDALNPTDKSSDITVSKKELTKLMDALDPIIGRFGTNWRMSIRNNLKKTETDYLASGIVSISAIIHRELKDADEGFCKIEILSTSDFDGDTPRYECSINENTVTINMYPLKANWFFGDEEFICCTRDVDLSISYQIPTSFSIKCIPTEKRYGKFQS